MLHRLRYTLAAIFLAASVGCLGLWWRSATHRDVLTGPSGLFPGKVVGLDAFAGIGSAQIVPREAVSVRFWTDWHWLDQRPPAVKRELFERFAAENGQFGLTLGGSMDNGVYFPLWYPALVFAVAAVGVLRLGKPFTIRAALIATTVVAVLLGMVVAL